MGTPFSSVYESFQHSVTDDMYIAWSDPEINEDLLPFLITATTKFKGAEHNLRDYDLDSEAFTEELVQDEISILTGLMVLEWIARQMQTVRLTELQYTGSDAKALNTKSQMDALIALKGSVQKDVRSEMMTYNYYKGSTGKYQVGSIGLTGKTSK